MRTLFFTSILLLCSLAVQAQYLGGRVGINFTTLTVSTDGADVSFDRQTNLMLGAYLDLPLGGNRFFLSPELSYVGRGYGFEFDFLGASTSTSLTLNYLDLGILAKFMVVENESLGFYLAGGPVVSYALSGTVEIDDVSEDIDFDDDDGFERSNFSLAFGAGLTFARIIFVEGRYTLGLSSITDEDVDMTTSKWNSIGINGGVRVPFGN